MSLQHAQRAAAVFHQPWFRCYAGNDPIGVELAGALKNVYALGRYLSLSSFSIRCSVVLWNTAAGAAAGLGYENNTRAGFITRSLAEMTRIGAAYGASPLTFLTLAGAYLVYRSVSAADSHAGVGDLFLTCSSSTSRVSVYQSTAVSVS